MFLRTVRVAVTAGFVGVAALFGAGAETAVAQDLTIGLQGSITSIDPHFHALATNNNVAQHLFDRLIHQDERQRLTPGLATSWSALDETTWELRLRKGVKFHDGSDFDAQDVIATIKRVPWVPNSPSSFTGFVRPIVETVVVDPHTIRFRTSAPAPLLPAMLTSVNIVSRKAVEAPSADFNSGKAAIGTGPFRFVEFVPGDRVVVVRNDAYWGDKPHWAKVTMKLIPNNAARTAALLAGDVQMIEAVPSADMPRLKENPQVAIARITSNRLIYLAFDQSRDQTPFVTDKAGALLPNNPLKDPRVRQAISKAINRQGIVDRVFDGDAIGAGGLLPEGSFGASPRLKPDGLDQEGARKLLAAAGYPNGFALTLHGPNDRYPNDERVLQAIGPMLTRVGIDAKVVTLPWATYASQGSAPTYAYSVMLFGWGSNTGETSDTMRALIATPNRDKGMGASNRGRYSNPKFDLLLDKALGTIDDRAREQLLFEASELALGEHGIVPLYYQVNTWATRKGIVYSARQDEYSLAQFVRPAN
ncbi:MAG: ABC transporter substrate-binding protein [Alphaproteobacteria bacterium]|nr:ABC transporter substrate-binding protein [Alphaproteobacteria bacterium]